jgi:hypothetical protein
LIVRRSKGGLVGRPFPLGIAPGTVKIHQIRHPLDHVPKKLIDFFDQNMLQLFDFERFLFDPMIPSDREAL